MKKIILLLSLCVSSILLKAQNVPSYVPTNGLVGWWPFSGNAIDSSGNGNNGTVNNGAALTTDRFGNTNAAFDFDGLDDYISATPSLPTGSAPRTVSCWFKTTAGAIPTSQYPNYQTMTGWGSPFGGPIIFPQHVVAPTGRAYFESGSGGNQLNSQGAVNDGTWHQIVTTYDGAGSRVKMYIDGVLHDSSAIVTLGTASSYFGIGNVSWANIPFRGQIDDVGLWNRALTASEVSNLYVFCNVSVVTQPQNQILNSGTNASFRISSSSSSATYQWQTDLGFGFVNLSNSGQYSGVNNDTLIISNVGTANNNQTFRCIATDGSCSDTSAIASLSICAGINLQPINQNAVVGNNVLFTSSTADASAIYQWQTDLGFGFVNLSNSGQYNGATNDSLTVSNVSLTNNNQQFRCILSAGACTDTSDVAVLTVTNSTNINHLNNNSIKIYPNPASTFLMIENADFDKTSESNVRISNMLGQIVYNQNINQQLFQIDLTEWSGKGLYLVEIVDYDGKQLFIQKLVVD
jgi:hypothetical protein